MDKRWRFRWQVIRVWHDDGTVAAVCSHRSERRANQCRFWRTVLAVAGSANPAYEYDVRLRPNVTHGQA